MQRRKQRTGADVERTLRDLADTARDTQPMIRTERERLQNEQVEGAAEQVCFVGQGRLLSSSDMRTLLLSEVNRNWTLRVRGDLR